MQRIPKRLAISIALVLTAAMGCSSGKKSDRPLIAFVTNGVDPFWDVAAAGARAAAREFDVELDVRMPTKGAVEQKEMIEDLLARSVDGIALSPVDPGNQTSLIDDACSRTKVVTHDSDAPASKRLCYIGMNNYEAGRRAGELLRKALPQGGQVMIFVGRLEQDNARLRRQGTIDALLGRPADPSRSDPADAHLVGEGYEVLGTLTDQFDSTVAKANAEDSLSKHPNLAAMVGLFAYNAPACLEALRQAGKVGKVKIVSFDEQDAALQGVQDGTIVATVVQNPYYYGYDSVRILAALARGQDPGIPAGGAIDHPARVIDSANVAEFWADKKTKMRN